MSNEFALKFFEAMEMAPEGVVLWDAEDRMVMCNNRFRELHQHAAEIIGPGLKLEELLLRHKASGLRIVRDGEPEDWDEAELAIRKRKEVSEVVVHYGSKWIQIRRKILTDGSVIAFHTDITEIKRSEERFWKIFQSSPALVAISTAEKAIILDVNEVWLKTLGYKKSEVIGRTPYELKMFVEPDIRNRTVRRFDKERHVSIETQYFTKNGEVRDFLVSGGPIEFEEQDCYLFVSQDITALKQIEDKSRRHRDELAHVTRVTTMGEMATSLAHELNQPLAALSAYVNGSLQRIRAGEPISEPIINALEKASEQAERAGNIIRQLRNFVRKKELKFENVDINDAVRSATSFMRSELSLDQIDLVLDLTRKKLLVEGDPVLIQQVIFNLVKNSVEALNKLESGSGQITINTARKNGLVSFVIKDNGLGVPPEHRERLFEPYFSTKDSGLGLGLPICRSVIEDLNGEIWCEATATQGTAFQFHLPLATRITPK